ncbi:mitochondrial escape protein 2 [Phlyctochytrium planicorne]|nr:mitochondrial escape protein 2 [Phlyctochytrium planicorne]
MWSRAGAFARSLQSVAFRRSLIRMQSTASNTIIETSPRVLSGSIWLENIFPVKMGRFDPRHYWIKQYAQALRKEAKNSILPEAGAFPGKFQYDSSIANVKEGGVLLHFTYEGKSLEEAFDVIKNHIESKGLRSSFNFGKINPYLVKGEPFVEDIQSSVPTSRLRVEFSGPAPHQQALFAEFRPFGKIEDISLVQVPGKEVKTVAHIQFQKIRAAAAARTCLQSRKIGPSIITVEYEPPLIRNYVFNFVKDHPRISLPIILGILAALSIIIFDPLRIFFVTNEVTHRFSFRDAVSEWFNKATSYVRDYVYGGKYIKEKEENAEMFSEFEAHRTRLAAILRETPQSFVLITGPEGAGKSQLVKKTLESLPYKLVIDCNELATQRDHIVLSNLARQIGYFPIFTWFVSAGSFIDTIITASTGAKAGIASTNEEQIRRMLELVTISLNRITSKQRLARQEAISKTKEDELVRPQGADTSTEASAAAVASAQELKSTEVDYPVIVIDEFLTKEVGRNRYIYDLIAEWAAVLAENQIAHVVFISNNSAAQKRIGKVIPKRTVQTILLTDAKFESAQAYVRRRLGIVFSPQELDKCVEAIGGRLTDLELLVQKIQATSQSAHALSFPEIVMRSFHDIVNRSLSEIRKVGLREDASILEKDSVDWSPVQFWKIVQLLSKFEEISYDDLRYHALFKGEENAIQAIERAGLISVGLNNGAEACIVFITCYVRFPKLTGSHLGRPFSIKAGKPIFRAAFGELVNDAKLSAIMGIQTAKFLIKDEEAKIAKFEQEMLGLSKSLTPSTRDALTRAARRDVESRLDFLARQIGESQRKINEWDNEEKLKKKLLKLAE